MLFLKYTILIDGRLRQIKRQTYDQIRPSDEKNTIQVPPNI
jgi:hypothetical protein